MLHIASSQKTFVRSVVNIVREFGEMCARAHAHTLEGTLTASIYVWQMFMYKYSVFFMNKMSIGLCLCIHMGC